MQFRFSAENRRDLETGEMFSGLENQDYTVPVFESRGGGGASGSKTLLNDDRVEPHRSRVSVHKSMVWGASARGTTCFGRMRCGYCPIDIWDWDK